jgi:hypothetical protein
MIDAPRETERHKHLLWNGENIFTVTGCEEYA